MKKLTVGVVTFNNSIEELTRFYHSFQKSCETISPHFSIHLICTDNGSPSWLSQEQKVCTLPSLGNVGFAKATNLLMTFAFEELKSDYFITCNPDGFFHQRTLLELTRSASFYPDCLIEARTFPEEHPKSYDLEKKDTAWASGCCLLIPKIIYDTTQGFDENFFLYLEDVDFSFRCRLLKFGIKYCPEALFGHGLEGRSGGDTVRKKHLFISGRYFAWKWGLTEQQKLIENELKIHFGLGESELPKLEGVLAPSAQEFSDRNISNFDFFIFTPLRW
ncbi:MAG: glycosyltransferase [Proteobacteria bacterium]|nr:glycosyltransferase [Pseudomonadota bacterium]NDC25910.1 glycosyltransferase [Pseudomonadota bacterium]NDD05721.1 glycosyltransferase [Pseudomonadota bacterium]NDG27970.1 glycosyltransferase [Pseudomonadota bacterium]